MTLMPRLLTATLILLMMLLATATLASSAPFPGSGPVDRIATVGVEAP